MKLTLDRIAEIFDDDNSANWTGDNAFKGLQIIAKYIDPEKHDLICGASHDEIYGPDAEFLIERGLTEEDAIALANLNWSYNNLDDESFSCFV